PGAMAVRVVPRCFDACWDEATNAWHLLLEDFSETHSAATAWPLPPSVAQCESILGAWARFHAACWDDPRLGVSVGVWGDSDALAARLKKFTEVFSSFADRHGDRLPGERRKLFERL